MNNLTIYALDLGKTVGFNVNKNGKVVEKGSFDFKDLFQLWLTVRRMIQKRKPGLILIPYPTRFYNVILAHAKQMGVIESLATEYGITVIEVDDATCKKTVFGSGKTTKEQIMARYGEDNQHCADSLLFCEWYLKSSKD